MEANKFYDKYYAHALLACAGTPISPLLVLSAAFLESGKGESKLALKDNNFLAERLLAQNLALFIKQKSKKPSGEVYYIDAKFKTFSSPVDSFKGYVKNITNDRYKAHGTTATTDPKQQAIAVHAAGYATAKNYSKTLITLIDQFAGYSPKLSMFPVFLLALPYWLPFWASTIITGIFILYVLYQSGKIRIPPYLHRVL